MGFIVELRSFEFWFMIIHVVFDNWIFYRCWDGFGVEWSNYMCFYAINVIYKIN